VEEYDKYLQLLSARLGEEKRFFFGNRRLSSLDVIMASQLACVYHIPVSDNPFRERILKYRNLVRLFQYILCKYSPGYVACYAVAEAVRQEGKIDDPNAPIVRHRHVEEKKEREQKVPEERVSAEIEAVRRHNRLFMASAFGAVILFLVLRAG